MKKIRELIGMVNIEREKKKVLQNVKKPHEIKCLLDVAKKMDAMVFPNYYSYYCELEKLRACEICVF